MFCLFIVSVDRTIAIGSDFDPYGLLVISDPSDAISTSPRLFLLIFYLPLPFYTEQHCTSFPRLRKTLHHLDLTQTASPAFLDLIPHNSTSAHCVLPRTTAFFWLYFVLTRVLSVSLRYHSTFCYIHRTAYTDISHHLHSFIRSLLSQIYTYFTTFLHIGHIGTDYTRTSHF